MSKPESDYYKILGVAPEAEVEVITAAYRAMVKKYHPDRSQNDPSAEAHTKDINAAFHILNDPIERNNYDNARMATGIDPISSSPSESSYAREPMYEGPKERQRESDEAQGLPVANRATGSLCPSAAEEIFGRRWLAGLIVFPLCAIIVLIRIAGQADGAPAGVAAPPVGAAPNLVTSPSSGSLSKT